MHKKIEILTNAAILFTCVVASVALLQRINFHRHVSGREALKVGDAIPASWHVQTADAATVVAVVRSTCGYCTASMPFFQRIGGIRGVNLVFVSDEPVLTTDAYIRAHGLHPHQVISARVTQIPGTPTILVVKKDGTITRREIGTLPAERQADFLSALMRRPRAPKDT